MDVEFHLNQGLTCLRQAKLAEDPLVKARLLALARENLELVKRYGATRPKAKQAPPDA